MKELLDKLLKKRSSKERDGEQKQLKATLDSMFGEMDAANIKELNLIIKAIRFIKYFKHKIRINIERSRWN